MKVIFFGTPKIGATILESLVTNPEVEVQLVVTQPDKKEGRKLRLTSSPVKEMALKYGLPVLQPTKVATIIPELTALKPDFLITCAFGQFLPPKVLQIPQIEPLNLHGSLLPAYRGGAPIQMAIWNGDTETGMSLMRMVKGMDAGPYFAQAKLTIKPDINSEELFSEMADLGSVLLKENLKMIFEGKIDPLDQIESLVTFAPILKSEQEHLNWNNTTRNLHNQIRALSPQPGAWTTYKEQRYKILKTTALENCKNKIKTVIPGTILEINKKGITVATQDGQLQILVIQKAGKNPTPAGIFGLNAFQIGGKFI